MVDSLGEALPREMTRVRDEIMPEYQQIGAAGKPALMMMMRATLDLAQKALAEGDIVMMLQAYEELKGFEL